MAEPKTYVWVVRKPTGELVHQSVNARPNACRELYARQQRVPWATLKRDGYSVVVLEQRSVSTSTSKGGAGA